MILIAQRFQSPDGKYLSEVNALLQDTGNIFVSDPANQVFTIVPVLRRPSDQI